MSDHTTDVSLENAGVEYEHKDIRVGWMAASAFIILLVTIFAMFLISVLVSGVEARQASANPTPLPLSGAQPTPPPPRLQPNIVDRNAAETDMVLLRQQEEEILMTYGWVNQEAGIVRVPIDKAIELLTPGETTEGEPER